MWVHLFKKCVHKSKTQVTADRRFFFTDNIKFKQFKKFPYKPYKAYFIAGDFIVDRRPFRA